MKRILVVLLTLALLTGGTAHAEEPLSPWVILVYLTGTDLETQGGAASMDLLEMVEGTAGSGVRFVVQTGGTREWAVPDLIPNDRIARFEVAQGDLQPVYEGALQNMGEADTLRGFVEWSLANYPAEKYSLVLWDHGSGSINGVAFDELFDNDSLTLQELSSALESHEGAFEMIGFDACLMATLETAQAMMPYARYLVASEELEPGSGWDYRAMGQFLAQQPGADGAQLGQAIADGFLASNTASGEEAMTTLSVTDLQQLPALTEALDQAGWQMFDVMAQGSASLGRVVKGIHLAENYGGNTLEEGYTNMVDIGSMMQGIRDIVPAADQVLTALSQAVVYQVRGSGRQQATGLSMYYPLKVQGSQEYQVFKQTARSEGYRYFVAGMMYGAAQGETAGLAPDSTESSTAMEEAIQGLAPAAVPGFVSDAHSQLQVEALYLDEQGTYTLALDPAGMPSLLRATFTLLMDQGEEVYYSLGEDDEVQIDEEQGLIRDAFDGQWTALPDGQLLPLYLLNQQEAYNLYSAPVKLNGEQTNLRILYHWDRQAFEILGGWDGISQSGAADKDIIPIHPGDTIAPLYETYDTQTDEYLGLEEGDPYLAEEGFTIKYLRLPAADYWYNFALTDLYGLSTYTDFVRFLVDESGELWFFPEEGAA